MKHVPKLEKTVENSIRTEKKIHDVSIDIIFLPCIHL